jgi:hypothetical protein
MTQPKEFPPRRRPFALDNAAYLAFKAQRPWDRDSFVATVERISELPKAKQPAFVVAPDIVGGGYASLEHSETWRPWVKEQLPEVPVYLPVQEGMTLDGTAARLEGFDGVFVGGASELWKVQSSYWWCKLAHAMGKPCHVGRISGRERVCLMRAYEVDSIDSCVPLWSEGNRRSVVLGLSDPLPSFDPPPVEQFLNGWEAL